MYICVVCLFFFNDTATTEIYTLSLHDALPICRAPAPHDRPSGGREPRAVRARDEPPARPARRLRARGLLARARSEEHTSELQSRQYLVCRLLLEKKNNHHPILTQQREYNTHPA